MIKILIVNIKDRSVQTQPWEYSGLADAGRGLAVRLARHHGPGSLVLAPGLLVGTAIPSTCRLNMAGVGHQGELLLANMAGPFAQKLASMNIAALVIVGGGCKEYAQVVHLTEGSVQTVAMPSLSGMSVGDTIGQLRERFGETTAIVGIGPAGECLLPLASTFSTYPHGGEPVYQVGRNRLGRIFGSLGLKAVAITHGKNLAAHVHDSAAIYRLNKELGKMIVKHPICGGALPAYGSITLIKLLRQGKDLSLGDVSARNGFTPGLNRACAPGCVIGCLNRHASSAGEAYSSPAESEVRAGCEHLLGITDTSFARSLNEACFEQGLDSLEFVASVAMLCRALKLNISQQLVWELFEETRGLGLRGRMIGMTTSGLGQLFADREDLMDMVSRPAASAAPETQVSIPHRDPSLSDLSDIEYLHAYMLASESMGICLFTAFAVLDQKDGQTLLASLASAKVGQPITVEDMIRGGWDCLQLIHQSELALFSASRLPRVPEFAKVLYRYLQRRTS